MTMEPLYECSPLFSVSFFPFQQAYPLCRSPLNFRTTQVPIETLYGLGTAHLGQLYQNDFDLYRSEQDHLVG